MQVNSIHSIELFLLNFKFVPYKTQHIQVQSTHYTA